MGKFDRILIFSDIDGTFLGKNSALVERNLEAVRYFTSNGGHFTFATGRMIANLYKVIPNAAELVNFPAVLTNGTCRYDFRTGTVTEEVFMDPDATRALMRIYLEEFPEIGARASVRSGFFLNRMTDRLQRDMDRLPESAFRVVPASEWDYDKIYKIVFRGEAVELDRFREVVEPRFSDVLTFAKSNATFFETQSGGASKASMIGRIREELRAEGKRYTVYCVGDNENDLSMLEAADVAVCPANAIDAVKAVSDHVFCGYSEGVIGDLVEYLDRTL